jgi:hypothetical protein
MPRHNAQSLPKAALPDKMSGFPNLELCFCQSPLSSLELLHLQHAFGFVAVNPACGIQRYSLLIAVKGHLDESEVSILVCSETLHPVYLLQFVC